MNKGAQDAAPLMNRDQLAAERGLPIIRALLVSKRGSGTLLKHKRSRCEAPWNTSRCLPRAEGLTNWPLTTQTPAQSQCQSHVSLFCGQAKCPRRNEAGTLRKYLDKSPALYLPPQNGFIYTFATRHVLISHSSQPRMDGSKNAAEGFYQSINNDDSTPAELGLFFYFRVDKHRFEKQVKTEMGGRESFF